MNEDEENLSAHSYWLHAATFQSFKLLLCGPGVHLLIPPTPSSSAIDHSVHSVNSVVNNVSQRIKDAGKGNSVHGCAQPWEVGMDHGILGSAAINYDWKTNW